MLRYNILALFHNLSFARHLYTCHVAPQWKLQRADQKSNFIPKVQPVPLPAQNMHEKGSMGWTPVERSEDLQNSPSFFLGNRNLRAEKSKRFCAGK